MAKYHVGFCLFGIFAGRLNENKTLWVERTEVTDEALIAVRDYLLNQIENGKDSFGYEWTTNSGLTLSLVAKIGGGNNETD